ncbi:MAG: 16S rRNA (cytosine(1402)-N(4))-methyltransferase RsmH [Planctomycetaceae bacterium]
MSDSTASSSGAVHVPVLLTEVLHWLDPQPGQIIVDGTVGAGGHTAHILPRLAPGGRLIGLDRDPMMLSHAQSVLAATAESDGRYELVHASYAELRRVLSDRDIEAVDGVLVDLGLSSDQLAHADRGFGFESVGLDMRFDTTQGQNAKDLLNGASANELADIFYHYGEERFARRIARRIVENRPIETAAQLAEIAKRAAAPGRGRQRIHPATRVFQALRIAVNDELGALESLLQRELPASLRPGGRAVVISFHSLEDRLVKHAFRDGHWEVLTKKPVSASADEEHSNPRSRSAKLRAARWLGPDGKTADRRPDERVRGNWRTT